MFSRWFDPTMVHRLETLEPLHTLYNVIDRIIDVRRRCKLFPKAQLLLLDVLVGLIAAPVAR